MIPLLSRWACACNSAVLLIDFVVTLKRRVQFAVALCVVGGTLMTGAPKHVRQILFLRRTNGWIRALNATERSLHVVSWLVTRLLCEVEKGEERGTFITTLLTTC